jgi:hypothetical protein
MEFESSMGRGMRWFSNSLMDKFGSYIVIVIDETKFLHRIYTAIKAAGYKYLCGDVHYHALKKEGTLTPNGPVMHLASNNIEWEIGVNIPENAVLTHRDMFDKWNHFRWQNEWRIALCRGTKDTSAFELKIGSISDIAVMVPITELESAMQKVIARPDCRYLNNGYYGNASRKELREIFNMLGDQKGILMSTIG